MLTRLPLALLAATLAFGQTSGTTAAPTPATLAQMRVNQLTRLLNLTDAQKATALSIYTTAITSAQTLQDSLKTNHTSMTAAIQKNDSATIDSLATAGGVLQGKLMAINAKADASFYQILTTDQKAIFDAMPRGGGRGPGGPGMGGMGPGMGGMGGGMPRGRRGQ
jgi:Spy/CpxP family protein refolding chaperone